MAVINLGPGDDTRSGTNEADTINGNGGNDVLSGLDGDDEINGGTGRDTLRGDAGGDTLRGEGGKDLLFGGLDNDVLFGGGGNDRLDGGIGQDFLNGELGNAELTGGSEADNFQIDFGAGRILITDFQDDVDTLLLDGDWFPGKTVNQILTRFGSSSGGDSAIDLSRRGDDSPRIILLGVDNIFDLRDDIILI